MERTHRHLLRHLLRRSHHLRELTHDTSQTTQLLYALRPFLKDGKQNKVERAARLARLITIGKRFLTEGGGLPV